ncbi:TPA: hypothetical protein RQN23_004592, partial [Aeromonas veronii]|nr:hypothetical protein [Aeromonas veronii]
MPKLILISAMAFVLPSYAVPEQAGNAVLADNQKRLQLYSKSIQVTTSGLQRYYSREKSWPARLDILTEKGYASVPS